MAAVPVDAPVTQLLARARNGDAQALGTAYSAVYDELKRAADDMTEAEVARARAQMKAGLLMGLESPSSRAERMARNLAIWGRVPGLDEVAERIDAVSRDAVRDYAGRMIAQERNALALYGPAGAAPDLDRLRRRLAA